MQLPAVSGEFKVAMEPNIRFTPAGKAVWKARTVVNPRVRDDNGNWGDGESSWFDVVAFGRLAENAAESFEKGSLIHVTGRVKVEDWESGDKKGRTVSVLADYIGPSLTWDAARVVAMDRDAKTQPSGQASPSKESWGAQGSDEPPFRSGFSAGSPRTNEPVTV